MLSRTAFLFGVAECLLAIRFNPHNIWGRNFSRLKAAKTYPPQRGERRCGMAKRLLPLSKVYGLLEPGPVVLLTTIHKGRVNVMTMSWHTMMEFEPPLVGCVVSGRDF